MNWERHATDWPMAAHSRFILHKPHIWHIQEAGDGPLVLLIHGAGGATQSWRHLFPMLASSHRVIVIDLPGQGFTKLGAQQRCGLEEMAEDLSSLCASQGWKPDAIVGHSAGAAIALQIADRTPWLAPKIVGINAALDNFKGLAGVLFPIMAKTLAMLPMVADLFSASTSRNNSVQKIINGTGSHLEASDLSFYQHLFTDREHVNATLQMMSQWKLDPLVNKFPSITTKVLLLAGSNDQMVPSAVSEKATSRLPNAELKVLEGLGHLAHEECPTVVHDVILEFMGR